jgi:hypothetical protein
VTTENKDLSLKDVKKVALPFGYTAKAWIEPMELHSIKSIPIRDITTGLNILRTGSVDAADIEYHSAMYLIRENDLFTHRITVSNTLPSAPVEYKLSSIKHIMVLEKLSAFIKQEHELIADLKQHYGIQSYSELFPVQ